MRNGIRRAVLSVAIAAAVTSPAAFATNGYFTEGEGTVNRGMAGAGVAFPGDSLTMAVNPAGLVKVGSRFDASLGIFVPKRSETVSGTAGGFLDQTRDGDEDNPFWIPTIGYSSMIDSQSAWGLSVYGHGGMNTDYANNPLLAMGVPGTTANLGVDLAQVFLNGTYSRTISPGVSLGIAALLVYQKFEAFGLQPFTGFSVSPTNVTNLGHDTDTGFGARVGVLWDVTNTVSLGAAYQSEITSKFEDYKGLFADGGEFNVPSNYTVGVAFKATPTVDIALDWARINYSDSKSVSNPSANLTGCMGGDTTQCLGGSNGAGFGWDDIDVIKLGVQMQGSGGWTWRAGWNHGDNPIGPEDAFINILAPGVVQDHLNFGFTKELDKSSGINFVYLHAFEEEVTGAVPSFLGPGSATIQMEQDYIELGYSKKF